MKRVFEIDVLECPRCPGFQKAELQIKRHSIPKDSRIAVSAILGGLHHEYRLEKLAA